MDKLWNRIQQRLRAGSQKEDYSDEQQPSEKGAKRPSVGVQDLEDEDPDESSSVSSTNNEQNSTDKRLAGHDGQQVANNVPETNQRPAVQAAPVASATFYDCLTPMTRSRLYTLAQIGEDWLYLALLGIIMALLSIFMDSIITMFLGTRIWLSEEIQGQNLLLEYVAWCLVPILLVSFSTGFVHLCSPTAIGSGIPEMKTILRGVVLNEYLTFRTLVAKIVGLTFTLGSGLPLGKEGPSVHMASIVATLLSKLVASFQGIYENESRTSEMLSAACAVVSINQDAQGVAATFYAPIGGVLFSIEVTTVYFAVRNYWRGFFAACCGATIWRLLGFYIQNDESVSAIFKTNFQTQYPFDPVELLLFTFIGATCGLAAAAYIKFHREIVQFFRRHERISGFLQQNRFVYPTLVTLIITTSTFPPLMGKYTAATLSTHTTIEHLFSNRTWSLGSQDLASKEILDSWTTDSTGFHLHLILYILMLFWTSALASTIPTPSGVFIPVVKMGAAYGRLVGELMAAAYPAGIQYSHPAMIVPGSYAVVGAAAFSGAVTHTVSTSVILFEMTGQIVHIIPVILGVLISNAVCQSLQPSIYDSIIEIKKLPYLPPIASSNSISHKILVKDFMNKKNIPFIWKERCTYADLKALLSSHRKIISFPLVESPNSMKLLGSVARPDLLKLLYLHLGRERRLQEVCRRNSDTLTPAIQLLNTIGVGRHSTSAIINEHDTDSDNLTKKPDLINEKLIGEKFRPDLKGPRKSVGSGGGGGSSSSSSDEIGGIEFISVRDLERTQSEQQNRSTQLMGHITVLPPAKKSDRLISTTLTGTNSNPIHCERSITMAGRPRAATTTASVSSTTTITTTGGSAGSTPKVDDVDDDSDPTRLIISACANCHKYGATSIELCGDKQRPATNTSSNQEAGFGHNKRALRQVKSSPLSSADSGPKLGEEQLLNDCQKRVNAYEEAEKEFGGVAKFINHYDRGSSMDKDHLEKSIQEVEGHLASVKDTVPEIVVVVDSWLGDHDNTMGEPEQKSHQMDGAAKQPTRRLSLLKPPDEALGKMQSRASFRLATRPINSQDDEQKASGGGHVHEQPTPKPRRHTELRVSPAASPNLYHHHRYNQPLSHSVSSSPSLSSRPFKSILKTSSCNNMAKRPISIAQSPNINKLNGSMKLKRPSSVMMQDLASQEQEMRSDQDNTNNGLSIISKQVTGTTNQLSNLRFANLPDLRGHKFEEPLELGLEAGFGLQLQQQIRQRRKVRLPRLRVVDMTPEEQEQWEKEQLSAFIELDRCQIDEAPFQLVEQTSLYRVHTLFSMLGLNHAYVTSFGTLVGIVALKDIRYAIEKMLQSKV